MNTAQEALRIGFELDRRFHWLRGEMDLDERTLATKEPALLTLARVLDGHGIAWAIVGGIAAQVHLDEPQTTLDIEVAVLDRAAPPVAELVAAGFRHQASFLYSDQWIGAGDVPVQFADDPVWHEGIGRAVRVALGDTTLPILRAIDLLRTKLLAARDPARRKSKRLRDVADAVALVEQTPALLDELSDDQRAWLQLQ